MPIVETLSRRALNRATLQRQFLLERTDMSVGDMVDHLVGMQAQNPLDPYYALWARLDGFDPSRLAGMTIAREVVRGQFMRATLHLFTADDCLAVHPVTGDVLRRVFRSTQFAKDVDGMDLDSLLDSSWELLEERPMTRADLAAALGPLWPDRVAASLAQAATYLIPVVQVPPRGVWGDKGPAAWAPIETFLRRPYGEGMALEDLVIRYLAVFGPAAVKDMRVWSGLAGLSPVFERLRPRLITFRDESGAELFDLPDAPRPDPGIPAPPRLLPEYDNVLLGHSDRSRFFEGDAIPKGWVGNILVDGMFAGGWKVREGKILELSVTERGLADREALHDEAERLVATAWPEEVDEIRFEAF